MTLFPLKKERADTNEDLQLLETKYLSLDASYLNVHMRKDWVVVRETIDKEWLEFKEFADKNFISEIQTNFTSRSWELYLFYVFHKNNFVCMPQSKNGATPDFKIGLKDRALFIEAVAAKNGENNNKVEIISELLSKVPPGTMISRGGPIDNFNHPKVRRILNSLDGKIKIYNEKYKKIVNEKDYFIIAVNGADIDGDLSAEDLIIEATLGINPAFHFPRKNDGTFGLAYKTTRVVIPNSNNTNEIDLGVFSQKEYEEISAIIYFGSSIINAILHDKDKEIIVIHNPNVILNKKIDISLLSCFRQVVKTAEGIEYIEAKL